MGMDCGMTTAEALLLNGNGCNTRNNNDGFFGGDGSWVFFLFFLLAWGNGGWGNGFGGFGGNNGGCNPCGGNFVTRADLCESFNFNDLQRQTQGITQGICDGFYAMNSSLMNGFHGVDAALCTGFNGVNANITNLGYQLKDCCCETNRNIDAVRYENAKTACEIMQNADKNTQRIVDVMTQNTIQGLRDELQAAQLQLGNLSQTQSLINELRPCAKPAYITCSPYQVNPAFGSGYGWNNSCGCGC